MSEKVADRAAAAEEARKTSDLARYAEDSSPRVRREVAANPASTPEILARLASDSDWRTRGAVALHPAAPDAALIRLIDDPRWEVHSSLLGRRDLSADVLMSGALSQQVWVRRLLADNDLLPHTIAERLCSDPDSEVRLRLAASTSFSDVLTMLATDKRRGVREQAQENIDRRAQGRVPDDATVHEALGEPDHVFYVGPPSRTSRDLARWSDPKRPRTRWLKSEDHYSPSDEIPPDILWQWNAVKAIDSDPAWTHWWEAAPQHRLHLAFTTNHLSGDNVDVRMNDKDLHVSATSRAVARLYRSPQEPPADELHEALTELLRTTMSTIAHRLDMPPTPALPGLKSARQLLDTH